MITFPSEPGSNYFQSRGKTQEKGVVHVSMYFSERQYRELNESQYSNTASRTLNIYFRI